MTKNKLYFLILLACLSSYSWFIFLRLTVIKKLNLDLTVCLFKRFTNLPCPSCGITRAVFSLYNGDILNSLYLNPFGILVAIIMVISPCWIVWDLIKRQDSFFKFYIKVGNCIRKKEIVISIIVLIIVNWVWNIYKNL